MDIATTRIASTAMINVECASNPNENELIDNNDYVNYNLNVKNNSNYFFLANDGKDRDEERLVNAMSVSGPTSTDHLDDTEVPGGSDLDTSAALDTQVGAFFYPCPDSPLCVTTLNCKSLVSNHEYVNALINSAQILFLQETWLRNDDQIEPLFNSKSRIYHKSAIPPSYKVGRPFGGIAWIIHNEISSKTRINFVTERISTCEYEYICFIGVYLTYNKQTTDSIVEYEEQMAEVIEQMQQMKMKNIKKVMILGDFNSDIFRKSSFDTVLRRVIEKERLTCLDCLFTQQVGHTYKNGNSKSHIDHVFINQGLAGHILQVNILSETKDQINTSDHTAIMVELKTEKLAKKQRGRVAN